MVIIRFRVQFVINLHEWTFALIVYAHPYRARNSCRNGMLRHARARAQRTKSIHIKGFKGDRLQIIVASEHILIS